MQLVAHIFDLLRIRTRLNYVLIFISYSSYKEGTIDVLKQGMMFICKSLPFSYLEKIHLDNCQYTLLTTEVLIKILVSDLSKRGELACR